MQSSKQEEGDGDETFDLISFLNETQAVLPFACSECSLSFNAECDLNLHKTTHIKTEDFICLCCKKQFPSTQKKKINKNILFM